MTLAFPNPSRNFDPKRRGVHFTGYDGMMEVPFFVEADALVDRSAAVQDYQLLEKQLVSAFDVMNQLIYKVAERMYYRGRHKSYTLTAVDFR